MSIRRAVRKRVRAQRSPFGAESCVRRLARAGRARRADGEPLRASKGMKRVHDVAWPVIGLGAVAVSSWLLVQGIARPVVRRRFATPSPRFRRSVGCWPRYRPASPMPRSPGTTRSRSASRPPLQLALRRAGVVHHLRARPQHRRHGSLGRGRALPRLFDQGARGGGDRAARRLLLLHVHAGRADAGRIRPHLPSRAGRPLSSMRRCGRVGPRAALLLGLSSLYVLGSLLHFRPLKLRRLELVYPRPPIARAANAGRAARVDRRGRHHLFRAAAKRQSGFRDRARRLSSPPFRSRLSAMRPGGLGVLEFSFLKAMPDAPQANVVAACWFSASFISSCR